MCMVCFIRANSQVCRIVNMAGLSCDVKLAIGESIAYLPPFVGLVSGMCVKNNLYRWCSHTTEAEDDEKWRW